MFWKGTYHEQLFCTALRALQFSLKFYGSVKTEWKTKNEAIVLAN